MTRLQRWSLAVIACVAGCVPLRAQPPQYEIRGTVTEPGVGPVAGVEVRTGGSPFLEPRAEQITSTNTRGEFVIRTTTPGQYSLRAFREGYVIAGAYASVNADRPNTTVGISIFRLGRIFGRVLDSETREPLPDIMVYVVEKQKSRDGSSQWGRPASSDRQTSLRTDLAGAFDFSLPRGDYAVTTVNPSQSLGTRLKTEYSPDDLKVIDQDFESSYWPSGTGRETAVPVALPSGGTLNIGNILVKKTPQYRAHVAIPQGECPEGESINLFLLRRGFDPSYQAVSCGKDVLLHHLAPGAYTLYAVSAWQGERERVEDAVWANASFVITDENTNLTLTPQRGIILDVQMTAAEGAALPDYAFFGFIPAWADSATYQAEQFVQTGKEGRFRMAVSPGDQTLTMSARISGFVTSIRYNGSPMGLAIPFRSGALEQRLEVVYDTRPTMLIGRVLDGERIVPGSRVYLWSEGQPMRTVLAREGSFMFEALLPGEYRVLATRSPELDPALDPSRGEKISLKPRDALDLVLKPR